MTESRSWPPDRPSVDIDPDLVTSRAPAGYPPEWEHDALLADGTPVQLRPIRAEDADALVEFHGRLSFETIYRRFLSAHPNLSAREAHWFTNLDYQNRFALVATVADTIIAVARYDRVAPETAEVAFVVEDAHQGRGAGSLLLEQLAAAARERGIRTFRADTFAGNSAMLGVFRDAGFDAKRHMEDGVVSLEFPIAETPAYDVATAERERRAEVASMRRLLWPRSIAVVGAGRRPGTIGHEILRNLVDGGFTGVVYPVNREASAVAGVPAFSSVRDIPSNVDLAVVAVPADAVAAVIDDCATKGTRAAVIISAGFAEVGEDGRSREAEVLRIARRAGMRVVGPNCMGIVNTAPAERMNATFAPVQPLEGRVGMLSQSGAVGITMLERAESQGLGVSSFVSVGNKADVSGNDLIQYWESDASTDVVLLYLESFGNPRKFARLARRVSQSKPIVVLKSGRTDVGSRAARSHTAAAASPEAAVDALFRQAGVIRAGDLGELFDIALLLAHQPVPQGTRVAIVGNSGGPGILAADACEEAGLTLAELSEATVTALRSTLPAEATLANPLDLIAAASAHQYHLALEALLDDDGVDAIVAIFTPPLVTRTEDVVAAIAAAARERRKPVLAVLLGPVATSGCLPPDAETGAIVPSYALPERAVHSLGRAAAYGKWLSRTIGTVPAFADADVEGARRTVDDALRDLGGEGGWLEPATAAAVLGAFGIPCVETTLVTGAEEAEAAAAALGGSVVLKASGASLLHKSDIGGVVLGITSPDDAARSFTSLRARLGASMEAAVVQPMAEGGVETIVGVVHDPSFGPLVMFGMGGVATDLLGDRGFRILPVTDVDAAELVRSLRSSPLLTGYRGAEPVDLGALEAVVLRVAALADAIPEVAELDLNPVIASPSGALAVDFRVRVRPATRGPGPLTRRLR